MFGINSKTTKHNINVKKYKVISFEKYGSLKKVSVLFIF